MIHKLYSTPANVTPEQEAFIKRQYQSCLDSAAFLDSTQPERVTDADWEDQRERNRAHLVIMLEKPYWTNEDLAPIKIALGIIPKPIPVPVPTLEQPPVVAIEVTAPVERPKRILNAFEQCLKHIFPF